MMDDSTILVSLRHLNQSLVIHTRLSEPKRFIFDMLEAGCISQYLQLISTITLPLALEVFNLSKAFFASSNVKVLSTTIISADNI